MYNVHWAIATAIFGNEYRKGEEKTERSTFTGEESKMTSV